MEEYNGELYGGTYDNGGATGGRLHKWNGTNAWTLVATTLNAQNACYSLEVHGGKLFGGMGYNGKLFRWNDSDAWEEVADQLGAEDAIRTMHSFGGVLYGGTEDLGKLYYWNGSDAWEIAAEQLNSQLQVMELVELSGALYSPMYDGGRLFKYTPLVSVDGRCRHEEDPQTWANIQGGAGDYANDDADQFYAPDIVSSATAGKWKNINRCLILFDTSGIGAGAVVTAAVMSTHGVSKQKTLVDVSPTINVFSSLPASNIALVPGDFNSCGTTPFCDTAIAYNDWDISDYNDFTLNAAGRAAVIVDGISKLGLREATYDAPNQEPTPQSAQEIVSINSYTADKGAGFKPKLVVTYTNTEPAGLENKSANMGAKMIAARAI